MSAAVVAAYPNLITGQSQTIDSPAFTPTNGERLLAYVTNDIGVASGITPGVTDSQGNTYDFLGSVEETGNQRLYCYEWRGALSAVSTVVEADWGSGNQPFGAGIEVIRVSGSNLAIAAVIASNWQVTPGVGNNTVTSTNLTPPTAAGLMVAISMCTHSTGGGTPDIGTPGYTSIETLWNYGSFDNARSEYRQIVSTSAQAAFFSATGNRDHLTIATAIADLAAAPSAHLILGSPTLVF